MIFYGSGTSNRIIGEREEMTYPDFLEDPNRRFLKDVLNNPSLVTRVEGEHKKYVGVHTGASGVIPVVLVDKYGIVYFVGGWKVFKKSCYKFERSKARTKLIDDYRIFLKEYPHIFSEVEVKIFTHMIGKGWYVTDPVDLDRE